MNAIRNVVLVATLAAVPAANLAAADGPTGNATIIDTSWSSGIYTYDGSGNVKQIGDDVYRYDEYGRLARATVATPTVPAVTTTQQFTYDSYGNLKSIQTTAPSGTRTGGFAVNPDTNQLTGDCPAGSDPCFRGVYDAGSGNQLGRTTGTEYRWDPAGMMIELDQPAVRHERYVYDANDERIVVIDYASSASETKRRYALRGVDAKVARELTYTPSTNTWELTKDYVYRGGVLLASFTGNETDPSRHYHIDHLGTPRLVTDGNGYRLAAHTYLPFGREAEGSDTDTERMKFTGHERDGVAGSEGFDLDYMHARYYDANGGRFLSVDPGRDWDPRQPQSWNMYTYVSNNPVNRTDPTGKWKTEDHNALIDQALPGLTNGEREILKAASEAVDNVVLGGQSERSSPEHEMREGGDTVGEGAAKSAAFYDKKIGEARAFHALSQKSAGDGTGRSEALAMGSLNAVGAAMHLVSDGASPQHSGQQVWGLVTHPILAVRHMVSETSPTPILRNLIILQLRAVYASVYGDQALKQATTPR